MSSRERAHPHRRWYRVARLVAAVLVAATPVVAAQRVVAVGDVHGSIDGLTTILRTAGLIDESNAWVGGDTTLVQLGDLLDRGTSLREVMDLLMRLQIEAPASGGKVIVLLGNHETMNLLGERRDVNRDAYAAFADDRSEDRRDEAFKEFRRYWKQRGHELGRDASLSSAAREKWAAIYPLGYFEYADAFSPNGRYGSWLRRLPAAVVLDGTLFIHGGYGPALQGLTVDEINARVAAEIRSFDAYHASMVDSGLILPWFSAPEMAGEVMRETEVLDVLESEGEKIDDRRVARLENVRGFLSYDDWLIVNPEGPLWFRGAAKWDEAERGDDMAALLDGLGVERMVVGHSVQDSSRIAARFAGRVYLIDTGMLESAYSGTASALELSDGKITAMYPDERQILVDGSVPQPSPAPEELTLVPVGVD